MNGVLFAVCVALVARKVQGAYPEYEVPQQSAGGYRGPPVVPVILPGGFIADTEEVAKAKNLHFNAFAHAASALKDTKYNPAEEEYNSQPRYSSAQVRQPAYTPQQYSAPQQYSVPQQYSGPQHYSGPQQVYRAAQPLHGYDVPQRQTNYNVPQHKYTGPVSQAEETYTNPKPAVNYQSAYNAQPKYQGPPVIPVILPNGYIADTSDVEAAKEHHFQLVAQAQAAVARAQERANAKSYGYTAAPVAYARQDDDGQYEEPEQNYNQVYQAAPSTATYRSAAPRQQYQGPPAVPVVLPSGHIADTAEVAAAKISHLQQLLDAAQKSLPHQRYQHASR